MNTLIRLKENDGNKNSLNNIYKNGNWNTTLKQNLIINNGDQIALRNVFIDTQQISDQILIKTPTTLTMEFCKGTTLNHRMTLSVDGTKPANENTVLIDANNGYNVTNADPYTNPLRASQNISSGNSIKVDTITYYPSN